jgi:hypothetical protein
MKSTSHVVKKHVIRNDDLLEMSYFEPKEVDKCSDLVKYGKYSTSIHQILVSIIQI